MNTAAPLPPPSSPPLRLFEPDDRPTLLGIYRDKLQVFRAKTTAGCDLEAVRSFHKLHPALPAAEIRDEHVFAWLETQRLRLEAGEIGISQINKLCRHLSQVLKQLGSPPRGSAKKFWTGGKVAMPYLSLLVDVPAVEAPPLEVKPVLGNLESREIGLLLGACEALTWKELMPHTRNPPAVMAIAAPAYWRAVFTLAYNTGLRKIELLKGRRSWLFTDEHGTWLAVPKVKRMSCAGAVYLNAPAKAAWEVLTRVESELILGWPFGARYFDTLVCRIFARLNNPRLKGIKIKGFRKACGTELTKLGGQEIAGMHLRHSPKSVTVRNYTHIQAVVPFVERLPQPAVIQPSDQQLRLFADGEE